MIHLRTQFNLETLISRNIQMIQRNQTGHNNNNYSLFPALSIKVFSYIFTSLYRTFSGVFTDVQMSFESRVEELEGGPEVWSNKQLKQMTFTELHQWSLSWAN